MTTITRTCEIAAAPEAVWGVLADFGAISSWARNVNHSCLLEHGDDPAAVGTTRRVQAGRDTLVERITESSEPNVLGYDIEGLPPKLGRISNRWVLDGLGNRTTVRLTSSVDIGAHPVAWVAEQGLCLLLAKQSETMLAGLAARVEGSR